MVWDDSPHGGFSEATPWLPVKAPQRERNVASQDGRQGSMLERYRETLAFRQGSAVLRHGRTRFVDVAEPVLAFVREHEGEALVCAFNLSGRALTLGTDLAGRLVGPSEGASLTAGELALGPNGVAFVVPEGSAADVRFALGLAPTP